MKQDFINYYQQYFPNQEKFDSFLESLSTKNKPTLLFHKNDEEKLKALFAEHSLTFKKLDWYPFAIQWPEEAPLDTPLPGSKENLFYPMNAASLLPVVALDIQPTEMVLDACAAPGGKSLAMANLIDFAFGHQIANDLSFERYMRMRRIFKDFNREEIEPFSSPGETLYKDAPEMFDKILLDAPCSSEKHVWQDEKGLAAWTPKRIKKLRQKQYVLFDKLLRCLKPGGRIVYSTCAITPEENEKVVAKILKNRSKEVNLVNFDWSSYPGCKGWNSQEKTSFDVSSVRRLEPHLDHGFDPMFVAVFEKV